MGADAPSFVVPIFTFVTDSDSYRQMCESFARAGFTPRRASFVRLESAARQGEPEPYSTITELVSSIREPLFVLCHQDIRLDQGHGYDELVRAVRDLDVRDERWAIAGNAGGSRSLRVIRRITDPWGGSSTHALPARVHSLDENFLVIRTGTGIGCTPALRGFHLYATDFCLNALEQGRRAYVIDFHLRHLSSGRKDEAYHAARDEFVRYWDRKFGARYVRTTVELLFLSRWSVTKHVLGSATVRRVAKNHAVVAAVLGAVLAPR